MDCGFSKGSETLDLTSEWLGEMFEGDSADTCGGKFPLMLMDPHWRERIFNFNDIHLE